MSEAAASPADPGATLRSKSYRVLLVFAALIGVLVSFTSWCFLELVHWIQQEVSKTLPSGLGLHPVPWWWPLPPLAIADFAETYADQNERDYATFQAAVKDGRVEATTKI